jgi:hypothetical protein
MSERPEDLGAWAEGLFAEAKAYAERTRDQLLLDASERAALVLAAIIAGIVRFVLALLLFALLLVAGGLWLGDLLGDRALGFAAMAGVCALFWAFLALYWRLSGRERFMLAVINAIVHAR